MNIAVMGTGGVGQTLAAKLSESGHSVVIGTRNVAETMARQKRDRQEERPSSWHAGHPKIKLTTFAEASAFAEVIIFATFGSVVTKVIDMAGKDSFKGKVVVDATNPLDFSQGAPPKFAVTLGNSLGEQVQRHIPDAKVVKAFSTIGAHIMISPKREEGMPSFFVAGNDEAKKVVAEIIKPWGWGEPVDFGDIAASYWLEANAMMWIQYGFTHNTWSHAFRLLVK
jgi:predicted dinucleotide-binding enzyme